MAETGDISGATSVLNELPRPIIRTPVMKPNIPFPLARLEQDIKDNASIDRLSEWTEFRLSWGLHSSADKNKIDSLLTKAVSHSIADPTQITGRENSISTNETLSNLYNSANTLGLMDSKAIDKWNENLSKPGPVSDPYINATLQGPDGPDVLNNILGNLISKSPSAAQVRSATMLITGSSKLNIEEKTEWARRLMILPATSDDQLKALSRIGYSERGTGFEDWTSLAGQISNSAGFGPTSAKEIATELYFNSKFISARNKESISQTLRKISHASGNDAVTKFLMEAIEKRLGELK